MPRRSRLAMASTGLAAALACALVVPGAGAAQEPPSGPGQAAEARAGDAAWRLDAEAFYATVAVLWPSGAGWAVGPELGGGVQEPITLTPDGASFSSLAHAGVMASLPLNDRASVETELRVGLGDRLAVCPDSDCLPVRYGALLVGGAAGWRRLRFGTRGGVARVRGETVAVWSPVYVRLRF